MSVPRPRSRPASCTSTAAPARRPARGRASRRSAAGRAAARPARPASRCTTSPSSCASRATPSSTRRHGRHDRTTGSQTASCSLQANAKIAFASDIAGSQGSVRGFAHRGADNRPWSSMANTPRQEPHRGGKHGGSMASSTADVAPAETLELCSSENNAVPSGVWRLARLVASRSTAAEVARTVLYPSMQLQRRLHQTSEVSLVVGLVARSPEVRPVPHHRHRAARAEGPRPRRVRRGMDLAEPAARLPDRAGPRRGPDGRGHRRQPLPRLRRRHRGQLHRATPTRRSSPRSRSRPPS